MMNRYCMMGLVCLLGAFQADSLNAADIKVLQANERLKTQLPPAAMEGTGAWAVGDAYIATGQSIAINSLTASKGRLYEEQFAKDDAKRRVLVLAAHDQVPNFDPEFFDVEGEVIGSETVLVYRLPPSESLFVVMVAGKGDVWVKAKLETAKGLARAHAFFNGESYSEAARLFAKLTELGAQDAETEAFAKAASAEVNLQAGINGKPRRDSLKYLGEFYRKHENSEASLRAFYQLYKDQKPAERWLLEKLETLSAETHRPNNAAAFRKEISQRWSEK